MVHRPGQARGLRWAGPADPFSPSIWHSVARIYEPRGILGDHRCRVGAAVPELARKRASRGERVLHPVLGTDPLQASARTVNEANHRHTVMTSHLAGGKPGPVMKARTAGKGTGLRVKGETVTPVSGATGAPALPALYPGRHA